jgi:decaprenylphospho-beta-D-ribofuranose 2-oxidase
MVTMGGAVANDVHGKNHHRSGSFGEHVEWIDLLLPDGTPRRITPSSDPELFAATLGGIGLTGVILGLQQRLARVPSNAIELREIRLPDLDAFLERLDATEREYPHAVGWIDAITRGRAMGRGILELGRPAPSGVREPRGVHADIPFDLPSWTLNPYTVQAFNSAYYHRVPRGGRTRTIHVSRFLFPLDALQNWNRMYGRRGVYQFQCVVPFAEGRRAIIELMEEVVRSRGASFLAVLKSMGRAGRGMLSFPMPGFTLALDFPRRAATRSLIERLQDIALKYRGRVYLAKDACLSADQLPPMYPELERFRSVLRRIDPERRMQSDMSRRLQVHEG